MSLEFSPARARKRGDKRAPDDDDAALPGDDEVLTFADWCKLNAFSKATGYRILAGPRGKRPKYLQLSAKRIGITRGENRRWQKSRAR